MKYLGVALHIGRSGLLTVKTTEPPKIGSIAILKGRGPIGNVIDVFGPASSPYASIKLWRGFPSKQVSDVDVFVEDREERRFRRGRKHHAKRSY
ncbi:MAG: Gar1/Naf1 family protein [Candidatus Methanomethylicus sp.]|nr:Gar1/Naf1 family protein [Candidatus Methanomethylicus sp.]